jgi:hypothetical protein
MCRFLRRKSTPKTIAYLKLLAVSWGVVCASVLPGCISFGSGAVGMPWFLFLYIFGDVLKILPRFDFHPAAFGIVTLLILALAATRLSASIVATAWFGINALLGWVMLVSLFSGPPPG